MLIPNFAKSVIIPSDHDSETHASRPLFRHSEVMAHLIIDKITFYGPPQISE